MQKRTWIRGALTLAVIAGVAAALIASPVGAFDPGDKSKVRKIAKKKATKVFNNLIGPATANLLGTGDILVQAQDDPTSGYVDDATGTTTVNTVSITAPTAGLFIISGQVNIDNDDAAPNFATLDVTIDGTDVTPNGKAAAAELDDDTLDLDEDTLAYTITRPATAGAHTVAQVAECCTDFDYDSNELTVLFVPTGAVARTGSGGGGSGSSDAGGDA